jgi:hypothetical protein
VKSGRISFTYFEKFKEIVSRDWGGLQMVSFNRYKNVSIPDQVYLILFSNRTF